MAVEYDENGVGHVYAPNPKMQGEDWSKEYPPIKTSSLWLINKFTGEIFPNTAEFARRSDILEPYLGELPRDEAGEDSTVVRINRMLERGNKQDDAEVSVEGGELEDL